jgi:hypothetical protein
MEDNYEIVPTGQALIQKSGIQDLLGKIRPSWQGKDLINRVERLIPVDASSACQRLFNAATHDLKEKIVVLGVDLAKEVAQNYKLPPISKEEDVFRYSTSNTIDLAYRIGILNRPEWRRIHRCYEIRRDLEHEDNEYEAVLEDCFYIFKSTIDIVLSKDPIELLKITDVKQLIENPVNVTISEEFLEDFNNAPPLRQKEITELLVSYAFDETKPDIVRENSVEVMRHIKPITTTTVTIEIAAIIEKRLGKNGIDLKTAKIGHACGAIGYFKKVRLRDFYSYLRDELKTATSDWDKQTKMCSTLEDIGGLRYCPDEFYSEILKILVSFYIGEPSYGQWSGYRQVFFSYRAAPIIARIIKEDSKKATPKIEDLRNDKHINLSLGNKFVSRRFEDLIDKSE